MTVHTAPRRALQWNVKPWKRLSFFFYNPSSLHSQHTCNPISIPAWKWEITRLRNNLYESSHVHSLFTFSQEEKETVVSMETEGWPMVGVFCLTVWRAACWDGHWSWQSECLPIIFIAKKVGTGKSALPERLFLLILHRLKMFTFWFHSPQVLVMSLFRRQIHPEIYLDM